MFPLRPLHGSVTRKVLCHWESILFLHTIANTGSLVQHRQCHWESMFSFHTIANTGSLAQHRQCRALGLGHPALGPLRSALRLLQ